jgi:energy-coupling factor transport system substrate-specific component
VSTLSQRTLLIGVNALGLLAFFWPFLLDGEFGNASPFVPYLWALALPALLLVAAQVLLGRQRDIRQVTLIATLIALGAAVRPLGAGVAGIEPVWAVILLAGRALGARAGFLIGALTMLTSAAITGGVGPWLPFQMMVAAWVGASPGLLPTLRGRAEVALLAAFGFISGLAVGALLNLWFWPLAIGLTPDISFVSGSGAFTNLEHWLRYGSLTSFGFDIPRGVLTALLLAVSAPGLLPILRRASRRARITAELVPSP